MSSRKVKKYRGPSRPVDPRFVPGQPKRKGPDTLGFAIIGGSAAFVLIIILFIAASQPPNTTTTTTTDTGSSSSSTNPTIALDASTGGAEATQTVIAFNTETAGQPRISPADAKAQIAANKVKVFDVRVKEIYAQEHIVGAVNIPYTDAQTRLSEFPKTGDILLYCQ